MIVGNAEVGADLVRVWNAEFVEDVEGVTPVLACLPDVAEGVVRVAEAGVGAGLLATLPDLAGVPVSLGVRGNCSGEIAGRLGGFAESVERDGLAVRVAEVLA